MLSKHSSREVLCTYYDLYELCALGASGVGPRRQSDAAAVASARAGRAAAGQPPAHDARHGPPAALRLRLSLRVGRTSDHWTRRRWLHWHHWRRRRREADADDRRHRHVGWWSGRLALRVGTHEHQRPAQLRRRRRLRQRPRATPPFIDIIVSSFALLLYSYQSYVDAIWAVSTST